MGMSSTLTALNTIQDPVTLGFSLQAGLLPWIQDWRALSMHTCLTHPCIGTSNAARARSSSRCHFLTPHPLVHISVKGNSIFPVTQSPDPCLLSHGTSKNKSSQECLQIVTESDPLTATTTPGRAITILTQTTAINGQVESLLPPQLPFRTQQSERLHHSINQVMFLLSQNPPKTTRGEVKILKWTTRPLSSPANLPCSLISSPATFLCSLCSRYSGLLEPAKQALPRAPHAP